MIIDFFIILNFLPYFYSKTIIIIRSAGVGKNRKINKRRDAAYLVPESTLNQVESKAFITVYKLYQHLI